MDLDETFSMDPAKFIVIYPSYLDSSKTIAQGRRIGAETAVDTPTVSDISQALQRLKIRHVLQPHKGYSRDIRTLWDNPGRVKVEPNTFKRKALLVEVAKIIPDLASRQQRLEQEQQQRALLEEKAKEEAKLLRERQSQKQVQQQQKVSTTKSSKKKGKKKR
jgi:signal recognition particle subunit SRP19